MMTIGHLSGVAAQVTPLHAPGKPLSCPGPKTSTFLITNRRAWAVSNLKGFRDASNSPRFFPSARTRPSPELPQPMVIAGMSRRTLR
jgi:hypothetical protein